MALRLTLYELSERHGLNESEAARLEHLAGLRQAPEALARKVILGVAAVAAALPGRAQ